MNSTEISGYVLRYENMLMQYVEFSKAVKIEGKKKLKIVDIFLGFGQNIDCGCPQSIFCIKNKKIIGIPL